MTVTMPVMGWFGKKQLLGMVIRGICKDSILKVTAEMTLLGERNCILEGIVSPPIHSAEEQRSVGLNRHIPVQVVLEELLLPCLLLHYFINHTIKLQYAHAMKLPYIEACLKYP